LRTSLIALFFAMAVLARPVSAAPVLDQNYSPSLDFSAAVTRGPLYVDEDKAQTFTVGLTGLLDRIEVPVSRHPTTTGPLGLEVRTVIGGVPAADGVLGSVLASVEISLLGIPPLPGGGYTWVAATGLNIPVTQGQQLAIVLQNLDVNFIGWGANLTYGGGALFTRENNAAWQGLGAFDGAFRTYVAVPETGGWLMLTGATALVAGGAVLKRWRNPPSTTASA
jgi:hypothetical protein